MSHQNQESSACRTIQLELCDTSAITVFQERMKKALEDGLSNKLYNTIATPSTTGDVRLVLPKIGMDETGLFDKVHVIAMDGGDESQGGGSEPTIGDGSYYCNEDPDHPGDHSIEVHLKNPTLTEPEQLIKGAAYRLSNFRWTDDNLEARNFDYVDQAAKVRLGRAQRLDNRSLLWHLEMQEPLSFGKISCKVTNAGSSVHDLTFDVEGTTTFTVEELLG